MAQQTQKIKAYYIFYILALGVLLISAILYLNLQTTKDKISIVNDEANLRYVKSLVYNLSRDIIRATQKDLVHSIKDDAIIKEYIEADLRLFITTKYKYIYLIYKNDKGDFLLLADSTKDSSVKSNNLKACPKFACKDELVKVYKSQKYYYKKHLNDKNIGATYLEPIIIDNKVKAIIAVEFSLEEQNIIANELKTLEDVFFLAIIFFVIVFILIIWFSSIDKIREKEKVIVLRKLQESNKNLEVETDKVNKLNSNLEQRVSQEVEKNRIQDQQLMHQSRLAQMGEMMSMIAHQWRQPLSAISSASISINLKSDLDKLDKQTAKELSKNISDYVQHLSATIDDFRDFFKPNKEKKETTFNELITSVLKIVEASIKTSNIKIIQEQNCEDKFFTYPNEIKQVILNLIKNAEDILIDNNIQNAYIKICTRKEDGSFILEVSDNGGGVPENILPNIFDPYFSTKTKKDGTGLGLYMSKTIIEEHCGGSLNISNDHNGAVFKILLGKNNE